MVLGRLDGPPSTLHWVCIISINDIAFCILLTLVNSGLAWPCGGGPAWRTKDVALERLDCSLPLFLGMHHLCRRSWHL